MRRCDSAAIVSNTRELLPEPETPVNTVSRRLGISTLTFLRLFSRAPCTRMRSCELAAGIGLGILHQARYVAVGVLGGHPLAVAIGVESDVLATNVPADVVRRLVGRRGPQQRGVHLLRAVQILDRVDNRLHACSHETLSSWCVTSTPCAASVV